MLGADLVGEIVEILKISGADMHRADAEADVSAIDEVEIDEALQRRLQGSGVIIAERAGRPGRLPDATNLPIISR